MKHALARRDDGRRIASALAVIQRSQHERLSLCPEIFDLTCVCAVHDRSYTLRFVRQASGLLRFKESLKGFARDFPDNARAEAVVYTLRLELFEKGATPCAWCGNGSFHHCRTYCEALVCGGRIIGETFHCRESCGASWVGTPLHEVKGETRSQPLTESSLQRSLSSPRRSAITNPRLMLPAAKTGGQ